MLAKFSEVDLAYWLVICCVLTMLHVIIFHRSPVVLTLYTRTKSLRPRTILALCFHTWPHLDATSMSWVSWPASPSDFDTSPNAFISHGSPGRLLSAHTLFHIVIVIILLLRVIARDTVVSSVHGLLMYPLHYAQSCWCGQALECWYGVTTSAYYVWLTCLLGLCDSYISAWEGPPEVDDVAPCCVHIPK